MIPRRKKIYEGKAKILFEGTEAGTIIQHFKDDATAFNNTKKGIISGKGVLNNRISEFIMLRLGEIGVATHFIKAINMREQLVKEVEIIPIEVIVRNVAAGTFSKRLGIEEGTLLSRSLVEFCYKNDALGDPLIGEEHAIIMGWMDPFEMEEIKKIALRVNDYLTGLFRGVNIRLIDFKLEFGRLIHPNGFGLDLVLADEISPDSCRLWDVNTQEKMDKDRFRRDLGKVEEGYREVARRLGLWTERSSIENEEESEIL